MLPKSARPTTKSVHYLLRKGKRWHGNYVSISWVGGQRRTRRGVHIAKKVARHATQRNAAKRAVFAAIESVDTGMVSDGLFFITVNKKHAHLREQLVASGGDISIYNRVLSPIRGDIIRFVSWYQKRA